jgi:hypothetical protein
MEGAAFSAGEALVTDHAHLKLMVSREHGVIPDGVENDVGDWIKLAITVASLQEAPVVAQLQAGRGEGGNCLEVETMDCIQKDLCQIQFKVKRN